MISDSNGNKYHIYDILLEQGLGSLVPVNVDSDYLKDKYPDAKNAKYKFNFLDLFWIDKIGNIGAK
jgi:hypothetical protein